MRLISPPASLFAGHISTCFIIYTETCITSEILNLLSVSMFQYNVSKIKFINIKKSIRGI